jgi:hypothetical protein
VSASVTAGRLSLSLGSFGVSIPNLKVKLEILQLERSTEVAEVMAAFDKPMSQTTREYLLNKGLDNARVVGCMKWVWFQWLLCGMESVVRGRVGAFLADEMERLILSRRERNRAEPQSDWWLNEPSPTLKVSARQARFRSAFALLRWGGPVERRVGCGAHFAVHVCSPEGCQTGRSAAQTSGGL